MLVEADVSTVLLLLLLLGMVIRTLVVAVVPVAGGIVATAVVIPVATSLVCVRVAAAGPVAEPDVADGEEEGAGFRAGEESVAFVGTVAHSFTH